MGNKANKSEYRRHADSPHVICLANRVGAWLKPLIGEQLYRELAEKGEVDRSIIELKSGDSKIGSLVLFCSSRSETKLAERLEFMGPIYAIDHSVRLLKLCNSFDLKDLSRVFSPTLIAEDYFNVYFHLQCQAPTYFQVFHTGGISRCKSLMGDKTCSDCTFSDHVRYLAARSFEITYLKSESAYTLAAFGER